MTMTAPGIVIITADRITLPESGSSSNTFKTYLTDKNSDTDTAPRPFRFIGGNRTNRFPMTETDTAPHTADTVRADDRAKAGTMLT